MSYNPKIPSHCPPTEAAKFAGELFRAIKGSQPGEDDFKSFAELERKNIDLEDCKSWGLSVWRDIKGVEHARKAIPYFKKKRIVRFSVEQSDGRLRATPSSDQPDHFTFWKKDKCNLLNACEIVFFPEVQAK